MSPPPIYRGGAAEFSSVGYVARGEAGAVPAPGGSPPWSLRPYYRVLYNKLSAGEELRER
ncbi:hypothetical protein ACLOJK_027515 [Asimina triloba]